VPTAATVPSSAAPIPAAQPRALVPPFEDSRRSTSCARSSLRGFALVNGFAPVGPLSRHPALPIVATEPPPLANATTAVPSAPMASSRLGSLRHPRSGHYPTGRHPQTLPPRLRSGAVPRASSGTAPTTEPTIGASTPSARLRRPSAWQAICKAHLCHAPRRLRLIALQAFSLPPMESSSVPAAPTVTALHSASTAPRRHRLLPPVASHPHQPPSHPHVTPVVNSLRDARLPAAAKHQLGSNFDPRSFNPQRHGTRDSAHYVELCRIERRIPSSRLRLMST
jgi:hypothetical protein